MVSYSFQVRRVWCISRQCGSRAMAAGLPDLYIIA